MSGQKKKQATGSAEPAVVARKTPSEIASERRVFWQNVVQQTLSSLSLAAVDRPEVLDGRVAVLTRGGERIPIHAVHPVFACSVRTGDARMRALALSVQCTVFRIETPTGETFTLPLEEIRAVHTISDELMQQIQEQAELAAGELINQEEGEDAAAPFGFAAFTSMAKQRHGEQDAPTDDE